ncbi:putative Tat pathway signal sequence [Seiridium unicorne]|uniref:Tat pathway signal sequence n=1 Tax=Seiridium unicorne TaxID=138068 RepID=A0ABR2UVT5_9PEZI
MEEHIRVSEEAVFESKEFAESETLMRAHDIGGNQTTLYSRLTKSHRTHCIINSFLSGVLICSILAIWIHGRTTNAQQATNYEQDWYYSPALNATKHGSRLTQFNHTKWSPFISFDTDGSLDSANGNWTNILRSGMMSLSEEELKQVGGSPNSVRLPPESGGGYLAYLSSHHLLHCLYLLHQSLHQDYYSQFSVVWKLTPQRRLSHWDHCIETLRQYVTCDADTTVITHDWFEQITTPVPNQANPRRCADWNAHFQWQLDRQAPAPDRPVLKPQGVSERPVVPLEPPPGYMEMYNG